MSSSLTWSNGCAARACSQSVTWTLAGSRGAIPRELVSYFLIFSLAAALGRSYKKLSTTPTTSAAAAGQTMATRSVTYVSCGCCWWCLLAIHSVVCWDDGVFSELCLLLMMFACDTLGGVFGWWCLQWVLVCSWWCVSAMCALYL